MSQPNPILDFENKSIQLASLFGSLPITALNGLPLGTTGDSALGEVYLKVGLVGGVSFATSQVTPSSSVVTTNGTVAAGKKHIEFILSSDFAGTINGVAYSGATDAVQSFDAPVDGTFAAMSYTISAGSARLLTW